MNSNDREIDRTEVVEAAWPYDGPHSAESVAEAANAVAGLVRYMNNATQVGTRDRTLAYAHTVDRVLGGVTSAVYGLQQLLDQLAASMDRQSEDPTLYDDRRDRPPFRTAVKLAANLRDIRDTTARQLAADLDAARQLSTHLGNEERP